MRNRTVIVLDGNWRNREWTERVFKEHFSDVSAKFFATEHEFREAFLEIKQNPPSLALLDVRVQWTDPVPDMPQPPPDVKEGGKRQGGFRCWQMIRQNKSTESMPVIFYTTIDERHNASQVIQRDGRTRFIERDGDTDTKIVEAVRQFLQAV